MLLYLSHEGRGEVPERVGVLKSDFLAGVFKCLLFLLACCRIEPTGFDFLARISGHLAHDSAPEFS